MQWHNKAKLIESFIVFFFQTLRDIPSQVGAVCCGSETQITGGVNEDSVAFPTCFSWCVFATGNREYVVNSFAHLRVPYQFKFTLRLVQTFISFILQVTQMMLAQCFVSLTLGLFCLFRGLPRWKWNSKRFRPRLALWGRGSERRPCLLVQQSMSTPKSPGPRGSTYLRITSCFLDTPDAFFSLPKPWIGDSWDQDSTRF